MLAIVSTPIGNLEDITLRAIKELQAADLILAEDTRTSSILLKKHGIEKRMISFHAQSPEKREDEILALLAEGSHLALITDAGTPGISDPGERLIRRAVAAGIQVVAFPGASAVLTALVVSGLPTAAFTFLGFIPHKKGRQTFIKQLAVSPHTTVFYESVHRIQKLLPEMLALLPPETPIAVARELTKMFEEVHRGTLAEVAAVISAQKPRGEYVVVVGAER